jgi:ketosteroid isomerase-like protein
MSSTLARRACVGALMLMFVSLIAFAQTTKPKADTSGTDQQVRTAQQQMLQAAIQGDKDGVNKFLADDVTWIGMTGQAMGKDQMLAALPAPVHSVEVQQILPMGKTAILVAVVHLKDGTERRALQEWVNRDGEWKVMAHQSTPISAEGTPTSGTTGTTPPAGTSGTGAASASEPRTVAPTLGSDEQRAVWRAQTEIVDAYSKGDTSAYSRLTANPFTRVQTNGQVCNRRQWLDLVAKNAKQPLKPGAVSDVQIQVDNANNVARVTMQILPFNPDGTQGSPERQTRIFALRNGQWQQVAAIGTPLSQR